MGLEVHPVHLSLRYIGQGEGVGIPFLHLEDVLRAAGTVDPGAVVQQVLPAPVGLGVDVVGDVLLQLHGIVGVEGVVLLDLSGVFALNLLLVHLFKGNHRDGQVAVLHAALVVQGQGGVGGDGVVALYLVGVEGAGFDVVDAHMEGLFHLGVLGALALAVQELIGDGLDPLGQGQIRHSRRGGAHQPGQHCRSQQPAGRAEALFHESSSFRFGGPGKGTGTGPSKTALWSDPDDFNRKSGKIQGWMEKSGTFAQIRGQSKAHAPWDVFRRTA